MKVIFTTNIDHYKTNCFPKDLTIPPRIGETVNVVQVFHEHFRTKRLPIRLQVFDVIWHEEFVVCELHYKNIDIEFAKVNGINLF